MALTDCEDVSSKAIFQNKRSLVVRAVDRYPQYNLKDFTTAFQITLKKIKILYWI